MLTLRAEIGFGTASRAFGEEHLLKLRLEYVPPLVLLQRLTPDGYIVGGQHSGTVDELERIFAHLYKDWRINDSDRQSSHDWRGIDRQRGVEKLALQVVDMLKELVLPSCLPALNDIVIELKLAGTPAVLPVRIRPYGGA